MAETTLSFDVLARDRASSTFNRIGRNTDSLSRKMGRLSRTARVALGGFAAFEAARAVKAIASIGIAYQDSLNVFQSVSRANAAEMQRVADKAKTLGANLKLPTTSAADAAAAMTELAKGGLNVRQSMQAALGTLQLATAAQVDGAQAAQIQSAALAQFGLGAKSAGHVADLLAGAANAAQGEITDMATALTYIGPVARAAGISVDETATAITALAKQGILGQKAGTGLRGVLTSLTKPSTEGAVALKALGVQAFDAKGNFVGFQKVAEELAAAQQKFTRQGFGNAVAAAFGRQQLAAVNALAATGTKQWVDYSKALANKNNVERVSEARSKGLGGALRGLQSQFETLAIDLYNKVAPGIERITRGLSERLPGFIDQVKAAFQRARPDLENFAQNTAKFARALGEALKSLKPFAEFVATVLVGAFRGVSNAMGKLADAPDLIKTITKAVVAGWVAWKTYTYWAKAAAAASLLAGGGAGAKGAAGSAAARGGIFGAAAAGTAKLVRMATAVRGAGAAWLGLGRAASLSGALIIGASQDNADAAQLNSDAIRFSISDYKKYTQQLKTATGSEREHILALLRVTEGFLEANHVTTVNGRILENLAGTLHGLPGLYEAAANGARNFIIALRGGGSDPSYGNFTDPGHPGYVAPSTSKTSGGHVGSGTGPGTVGFDIGKRMAKDVGKGIEKGLDSVQSGVIAAARAMVEKIDQQFQALKSKARDLARSIADTMRSSADLSNLSGTDSLGAAMAPTVAGIKSFLDDQLKNDRQFRRTLRALHARGLSDALYRQLAQAGPQAAGGVVQALAGASRADLRDISRTNRQIGNVAGGFGRSVSQDKYGAAIREAHHDQQEAHRLLRDLVREVKKDDDISKESLRGMGRQFRHSIRDLRIVTDTDKQDRKQGNRVVTG